MLFGVREGLGAEGTTELAKVKKKQEASAEGLAVLCYKGKGWERTGAPISLL